MRAKCRAVLTDALHYRSQQASYLHILHAAQRAPGRRRYATEAAVAATGSQRTASIARVSTSRYNEIGVQQVSDHVHKQLFAHSGLGAPPELVKLSKDHLTRHDLLGKNTDSSPPVAFDLPELQGKTLDEHFYRLGMDSAEPYMTLAKRFARASPPQKPRKWETKKSGWTKYFADGSWKAVDAPEEQVLTFDTEVMWKETSFPAMACAASDSAWYSWLSPWLLEESESDQHLIPLGDINTPRIIIGHNVGYDRARVAEEYQLSQSRNYFMDTMSLHVAVNGMCSRQRPQWVKHRKAREDREKVANSDASADLTALLQTRNDFDEEEELWVGRSSVNSLRDVAKFHCGITIDKARREWFGELDRAGIRERMDELLDYCAADVEVTHRVYQKVFPNFLETCPHPVSFAALRHLAAEILPVDKSWEAYIANAEATYHELSDGVEERLRDLAEKAVEIREQPHKYSSDPWMQQLDWSGQEIKYVKPKKKGDPPRMAARQKKPGMPKWYKDLFAKNDSPMGLTVRTRIAPILLRLSWDGFPLVWSDKHGWTFKVPLESISKYEGQAMKQADMSEEENLQLRDDAAHAYYKLPHKDGPQARCANPLAKGYLSFFEKGTLSSEYAYAKGALEMNASCSYWISARDRIMSQLVIYESEIDKTPSRPQAHEQGYILPQIIPMGTITRRAVENTWLTASNAKKNRVGSELKSMIKAPPGYCFVGADVDSQELWIASLVGDASFKLHGGNAIGFMTLEGSKAAGTDLHSRTAKILGITRNDAKVFNYGRIYGAGLKFASSLLRQFNPIVTEADAAKVAGNLYKETKGQRTNRKLLHERSFWRGGTESFVFNKLEDFAEQEKPRTPVLGAGITEALMRRFISKGGFMTSRINWAIQSSGVDYLHMLIISMDYLARRYNLDARLAITVHDEIRYLVKEEDKYRAAMALQVANVWTRAMFSQQMGINDLPQSCAYFSAIDIDHVLRKEVDMDCITPSHRTPIPHGESIDIMQLLEKGEAAVLDPNIVPVDKPVPEECLYIPRSPVMSALKASENIDYIRAQITSDDQELRQIVKEVKPATEKPKTTGGGARGRKKTAALSGDPSQQQPRLWPVDNEPWGTSKDWPWPDQKTRWQQNDKAGKADAPFIRRMPGNGRPPARI
ncbi:DNA polymerase gamma, mitochondrial [Elsinoe australis]|uniref:DNA-directed DNA polymerase n=1 Tax=Elsinoe australis TaxID=40998 RepID=A0A2P7Z4G5_9PEZI|nr:DNA polymerase gamma, mitochondrial [Elsinoe australis]